MRRRLLLARTRFAGRVGLAFLAGGTVLNILFAPDRLPERLIGFASQVAICLVALALTHWPPASRRVSIVVVGFIVALGGSLFYTLPLSPTDLDVMTAPITCIMIGSTLLFPWGGVPQVIVSGVMALGYAVFLWPHLDATGMRATNVGLSVGMSAALSVIGAFVLEHSRRAAFAERQRVRVLAVQRRHLIEIGRNLRSTLEPQTISERLVAHARRLIPADAALLALFDPDTGVYRITAVSGGEQVERCVGQHWDDRFHAAFCAALAPAEVRECPGSSLDPLLTPHLARLGIGRLLVAAVGPHPSPTGLLGWLRRSTEPFTRPQRMAAQGIADQAFTALSAARLYDEATRASQLKSEFVSTMSHELRTPLNVIMGYNQILSETIPADAEATRALDAVQRASVELLQLVEATLDLGRLEAGREQLEEEQVVVRELFSELAREFTGVPRAAGVALLWDVEDVPPLIVDRRKLKTVLKNLVGNALKFTPAGSVRVECRMVGARCRFRVVDTGVGIRAEDQAIIFEMFRQADSSDSRRYGGTGLGLYIVRQLLGLLGGEITLESAPGCGSTFAVTIPPAGAARARAAA
jgi:signal transduction histidine kinase